MSKSKAVVGKEKQTFNPEYYEAVNALIDNIQKLYQTATNQYGEIYRIASFVSIFARQKAYLDMLREEFSVAKEHHDLYTMKSVLYKVNNSLDTKVYDYLWSDIASMYDAMTTTLISDNEGHIDTTKIKDSEQILSEARKYYQESKENEFDLQVQTVQAMLDL